MPRAGRRLFRFHRRSAVRRRHCTSGSRRPRSTAANDPACHRMFRTGSRRWSGRTGSFASYPDPAQGVGLFCPGGSSTADRSHDRFVDEYREVHGVEPICKVLTIAPSTYHAHVAIASEPRCAPASEARCDADVEIARVFAENFDVYGVRKVWRALQREGSTLAVAQWSG